MKLTNTIRDAFVRRVMDDTPSVDYSEQIRSAAIRAAIAEMPAKVAAIWKDLELRQWIRVTSVGIDGVGGVYLPAPVEDYTDEKRAFTARMRAAVADLSSKAEEQKKVRQELQSKLRRAAYGYTTRKALADAMPEFAKYLPEDEAAANRSLPVVANVVSDFVKAGWPKDKGAAK